VHEHTHPDGKEKIGAFKDKLHKRTYQCQPTGQSSVLDAAKLDISLHSAQGKAMDVQHNKEHNGCSSHASIVERRDTYPMDIEDKPLDYPVMQGDRVEQVKAHLNTLTLQEQGQLADELGPQKDFQCV
jgi:hypothetical protein